MREFSYRPFEILRELRGKLKHKSAPARKSPADTSEDEEELFRKAMEGVREIKEFREIPYKSPVRRPQRIPTTDNQYLQILADIVSGRRSIEISKTQEYREWVNPDYQDLFLEPENISRLLHQGRFSVQDSIDLHGLTTPEAKDAVEAFLRHCRKEGLRCVKIIHGRGLRSPRGPVLKEAVLYWLRRDFRKWIIAYATAKAVDGGLGATYILLK